MKNDMDFIRSNNPILGDIAEKSPEYVNQIVEDIKSGKTSNIEQYVKDLILQDNRFSRNMHFSGIPSEENVKRAFSTVNGRTLGGNTGNSYLNLGAGNTGDYGPYGAIYQGKPNLMGDVSTWWDQRFVKIPGAEISHGGLHSE